MEKRNRYRNRIQPILILRLAVAALLLLAAGGGFVLVRNQHVIEGDRIRVLEEKITELNQEIEMWELRIAGVRDRQELSRRLRWVKSELSEIESAKVIELEVGAPASPPKP